METRKKYTDEQRKAIIEYKNKGYRPCEISKILGIPTKYIYYIIHKTKVIENSKTGEYTNYYRFNLPNEYRKNKKTSEKDIKRIYNSIIIYGFNSSIISKKLEIPYHIVYYYINRKRLSEYYKKKYYENREFYKEAKKKYGKKRYEIYKKTVLETMREKDRVSYDK